VLFQDVDCRWCYRSVCPQQHHACLLGVSPDDVAQAALELRAQTQMQPRAHSVPDAAAADHADPSTALAAAAQLGP
jgi:hypothetical protein